MHGKLGETALWAYRFDRARAELHEAIALSRAIGLDYVAVGALGQLSLLEQIDVGPERSVAIAREAVSLAEGRGWIAIPQTAGAHATLAAAALLSDLRPDDAERHLNRGARRARERRSPTDRLPRRGRRGAGPRGQRPARGRAARARALRGDAPGRGQRAVRARDDRLHARPRARASPATWTERGGGSGRSSASRGSIVAVTEARILLAEGDAGAAVDVLTRAVLRGVQRDGRRAARHARDRPRRDGRHRCRVAGGRGGARGLRAQRPSLAVHRGGASDGEPAARADPHGDRAPRDRRRAARRVRGPRSRRGGPVTPLLEPLSDREQAILRYLPTTLSNREIASELFVTTNTVKTHLRSIYRKLDVARRRDAVDRARDLRLLELRSSGASANPPSPNGSGSQ